MITLVALWLRRNGILANTINIEHYHDLGKWMFTVIVFWAYAGFAQYMLIWYANIPEETQYFYHRYQGTWYAVSVSLVFAHFLFPFLFMIGRTVKRRYATLAFASVYLLIICYVDVYWMVLPMLHKTGVQVHWLDFTTLAAVASGLALTLVPLIGQQRADESAVWRLDDDERVCVRVLGPHEEPCAGAGRRHPTGSESRVPESIE